MSQLRYITFAAVIIGLIAAAVWLQQCTMVAGLPPRHKCLNELDARAQAGPTAVAVLGTGSMVPYIPAAPTGADPLKTIVAYAVPSDRTFSDIRKGNLVIYRTSWSANLVIHQAAEKDKTGWIMSGLNNSRSESFTRVIEPNVICVVKEIYTW